MYIPQTCTLSHGWGHYRVCVCGGGCIVRRWGKEGGGRTGVQGMGDGVVSGACLAGPVSCILKLRTIRNIHVVVTGKQKCM